MRDTQGRNASNVKAIAQFSKDNGVDLHTVELDVQSQDSVDEPLRRSSPRAAAST
jgi:hypothetical protein